MNGQTQSFITASLSADASRFFDLTTCLLTSYDVSELPLTQELVAKPLLTGEFNESQPVLSPDCRWMAYCSDETGVFQVYIQSFPGGDQRQQVSVRGGTESLWRSDSRELFFLGADSAVMAAQVSASGRAELPQRLFKTRVPVAGNAYRRAFTATPDGQRFLVNTTPEGALQPGIHVVLGWRALRPTAR